MKHRARDLNEETGHAVVTTKADTVNATSKTKKKRYRLSELLAQCNKNAPPPADMAAWNAVKPIGKEIL